MRLLARLYDRLPDEVMTLYQAVRVTVPYRRLHSRRWIPKDAKVKVHPDNLYDQFPIPYHPCLNVFFFRQPKERTNFTP